MATIDLTAYAGQTIKLRFHATTGVDYRSDMAIDNISLVEIIPPSCTATVSTFPYNESFEGTGSGGTGLWVQATTDDGDWTVQTGGTPSGATGPSGATDGS